MKRPVLIALLLAVCAVAATAQTITMTISSDLLGATLSGSGSTAAGLSTGVIAKNSAAPAGFSKTTASSSWTLTTPFDVTVNKDLTLVSATYTLQAQLSTSDPTMIWTIDSVPLNASAAVTISATALYGVVPLSHTLAVQIGDRTSPGAVSNTITLTAVAN